VTCSCAILVLALIFGAGALPAFAQVISLGRQGYQPTTGTALLVVSYALYNILCISLALHAIRFPPPSRRWMGDIARRRARPWLAAASVVLLVVSLLVSIFVVVVYFAPAVVPAVEGRQDLEPFFAWVDLLVEALIALAVVLIGKATVSYEIFTGKTLPRRGFFRQWRRAVILAAGYSTLIAATITLALPPMYALIVATLLIVFFFALLSVRMFGERERSVRELRPLLTKSSTAGDSDNQSRAAFDTLCKSVLNVRVGYLCPIAPLAAPLAYPSNLTAP